jgi:hypothetical protein
VLAEGTVWKELRHFSVTTLRNLGFARPINEELEHLFEQLSIYSETKKPFDPHMLLMFVSGNIITSILFGVRYGYDDKEFSKLLADMSKKLSNSFGLFSFLALIRATRTLYSILPSVIIIFCMPSFDFFPLSPKRFFAFCNEIHACTVSSYS